jgi:3-hydroxyisobutyrate dehydrogenase-like beta-hydroxyacid dehydrogenase
MKLAANLLLATFLQALAESLLLVDAPGAEAAKAIDVLADSNIGAAILRARAPRIAAALNGDTSGAVEFDIDTLRKDLLYMVQEAALHGHSLPLASRTLECFERASAEGWGGMDIVTYPAWWIGRQRAAPIGGPQI